MCAPVLPATHAPAFQLSRDKPVTEEDIAKVHIALEHCIRRGLTKQEAVATLQQLGVEALVTALVWERLEEDNKQFFAAYHAHISRTRLSCSE